MIQAATVCDSGYVMHMSCICHVYGRTRCRRAGRPRSRGARSCGRRWRQPARASPPAPSHGGKLWPGYVWHHLLPKWSHTQVRCVRLGNKGDTGCPLATGGEGHAPPVLAPGWAVANEDGALSTQRRLRHWTKELVRRREGRQAQRSARRGARRVALDLLEHANQICKHTAGNGRHPRGIPRL